MEQIIDQNKCTGCTTCMNICPQSAVSMQVKNDGFKYPVINKIRCVDCGLCKKNCPVLNTKKNESISQCYVAYNRDDNAKMNSSSGGIFDALARKILNEDGIVIGASFDKNNKLYHIAIESIEELNLLKGSKYLQSNLNNIFSLIKSNINNKKILFVGTPCQVAGLKAFLKKDCDNLICIDLFCHGVPSPKLFDKYITELEEKYDDILVNYNFRDKSTGWDTYSNTAKLKNKEIKELHGKNNYMKLFLSDIALRESCYNCNFKLGNKYSDITLGDFWGVQNHYPEMYSKKGVSAIIINTQKGIDIFNNIKQYLEYKECDLEKIVNGNFSLKSSAIYPIRRNTFFNELDNSNIDYLVKKYVKKRPLYKRVLGKIKWLLRK